MQNRVFFGVACASLISLAALADPPKSNCQAGADTTLEIVSNAPKDKSGGPPHLIDVSMQGTINRMDAGETITVKAKAGGAVVKSLQWEGHWTCAGYSTERKEFLLIGQQVVATERLYVFVSLLSEAGVVRELDLDKSKHYGKDFSVSYDQKYLAFIGNNEVSDKAPDRLFAVELASLKLADVSAGKRWSGLNFIGPSKVEAGIDTTKKIKRATFDLSRVFAVRPPLTK